MAPKRRGGFRGRGINKRKKLNLLTIRQKKDYQELGGLHPVESRDDVKSYTKVEYTEDVKKEQSEDNSSSDENEEDIPVIKQLMAEIGMKEAEPDSEKEDKDEDSEDEEEELDEPGPLIGDSDSEEKSKDTSASESDIDDDTMEDTMSVEGGEKKTVVLEGEHMLSKKNKIKSDPDFSSDDINNHVEEKGCEVAMKEAKDDTDSEEQCGEEDEEKEVEEDENTDELCLKNSDPFRKHFELESDISSLAENSNMKWQKRQMKMPGLGESMILYKDAEYLPDSNTDSDLKKLYVKYKLSSQVPVTNKEVAHVQLKPGVKNSSCLLATSSASLTHTQHRLFCAMNSYQDLLYPKQTVENTEEIRLVYCLHALNHVLKTRSRIVAHNSKLKARKDDPDDDVDYRDQGLTRPKVLILLPYRDRALKVVNMFISLLSTTQQASVSNRKRFESEYSELEKSGLGEQTYKPEDFRKIFEGNTDDNFRVGMSVSKKSLRLYSPFYESDIILASSLGLRMIIGLEGDKERDYDFLSSIEVLIVDQTDIFLMQNWDHFVHVFKHLHLQPKETHGVDFSRVRMWSINGWSKHYRQTVMFSSGLLPELLAVFNKQCHNYTGKVLVQRDGQLGTIRSSVSDVPQIFHRVRCEAPDGLSQRKAKFEYLKKKIIPYHTSAGMKQTLIYCNYYSFVQLRNYFRESETEFIFINEYDTEKHMRNARIHFRKRHPHFMLYTERLHFHYRFKLRGIHHLVWFDLPQYPHFYPELVNLMETSYQACTSTVLFTRYDAQKLIEIVGSKQAAHMLNAEKSVNMITVS